MQVDNKEGVDKHESNCILYVHNVCGGGVIDV